MAYRHDSRHVLYTSTEQLHPDNLHGLAAASGNDYRQAEALDRVQVAPALRTTTERDLVLIGSPTAEGLSRLVFGYESDGDPDSLRADHPPLDLPYRWVISKADVDHLAMAKRYVVGRGLVARPNWRIAGPNRIYVPRVDDGGMLVEDYLLVTKVRNYLSTSAIDAGYYIVSLAGTHGTGTRALELLYRGTGVLRSVANELQARPMAYQLLFRVYDIVHNPASGSRARAIDLIDGVALSDTEHIWRTAHDIVRRGLRS